MTAFSLWARSSAAQTPPAEYAGSSSCAGCHAGEFEDWRHSHHAKAMQQASAQTVLGAFDGRKAASASSHARFFRKGDDYVVTTEGRDGKAADFTIDYTFGLTPLQQYLVTFPDGRLQALPYAWDTRRAEEGGQKWFHLYADESIAASDPLHWSGLQQNWNFMCADCHSTNVRKNYDKATNSFATQFSEISVGCESCHGPASAHVEWARRGKPDNADKGFATTRASEMDACATCHSRRSQFAEGWRPGKPLMDYYRPVLLTPDLFEDDGQMRGEVFNLSSFLQSKMHAKGVTCGDCHAPHSGQLRAQGAAVCTQCHAAETFAAPSHTGHAPTGAPNCIACHMPARNYMTIDRRHDHSFRIPRPDLTMSLGTPNTCNDCHRDKDAAWAAAAIEDWRGPQRKGFQTYARAFHAARKDLPEARALLLDVVRDSQTPAIARATALFLLRDRPSIEVDAAVASGLLDPDPLVRFAALAGLGHLTPDERWRRAAPLLSDPVRMVRIEAANILAEPPRADAPEALKQAQARAAEEYVAAENYNADRPESRANLAQFWMRQGKTQEAERELLSALDLEYALAPRLALAELYRATGRDDDAEVLLRQTVSIDPQSAEARHALGLALVRAKRHADAVEQLRRAHELAPQDARFAYVYAVALQEIGRRDEAAAVLRHALEANPSSTEILSMLARDALARKDIERALAYGERLQTLMPDNVALRQFLSRLRSANPPKD